MSDERLACAAALKRNLQKFDQLTNQLEPMAVGARIAPSHNCPVHRRWRQVAPPHRNRAVVDRQFSLMNEIISKSGHQERGVTGFLPGFPVVVPWSVALIGLWRTFTEFYLVYFFWNEWFLTISSWPAFAEDVPSYRVCFVFIKVFIDFYF